MIYHLKFKMINRMTSTPELNTVYDCFGGKSDYTKQALKDLNIQMKTFDFAKTNKKTRIRHKIEYDEYTDHIDDDDDDVVSVASSEPKRSRKSEPKQQPKPRAKQPKRVHDKSDDEVNTMTLIDNLQKRVESMKLRINKQSRDLDKASTDLYLQKLALSTKAVELEDSKIEHEKFVKIHDQMVVSHSSTIKSYRISIVGVISAAVLITVNVINYVIAASANTNTNNNTTHNIAMITDMYTCISDNQ